MKCNMILKFLSRVNFKTMFFNLKYLPFNQAIKLPILISNKVFLKEMKGKIKIESPIKTGLIQIGYGDVGIFDKKNSRTIWKVSGELIFKGKARIGHGSKISVNKGGVLQLGENFSISAESSIVVDVLVEFGNNCLISWDCLIMDTDLHKIRNIKGEIINHPTPIIIGNNVWIGCRNLILKGTKISDNTIIGASSVLHSDISNMVGVLVGNPIKIIKKGVTWEM